MKSLNEYIEQWFGQSAKSYDFLPLWQENLVFSELEKKQLELWKLTDIGNEMLFELDAAYQKDKLDIASEAFRFINRDLSAGFMMYVKKSEFSEHDFSCFFHFLKEKILELNYKVSLSDKRYFDRKTFAEEIQRHYLKPRLTFDEKGKANQIFGNIHLELYRRNDELIQLKLLITAYQDHNYQQARSFEDFFTAIIFSSNS